MIPRYAIREADGCDDAADLAMLHEQIFETSLPSETSAPRVDTSLGHWWLVTANRDPDPVAFAGLIPSDRYPLSGYYQRVGVLAPWRGHGLQLRLTRALEARGRRNGWQRIIADTTCNLPSANNFIRAGYRLFAPEYPWAHRETLYWTKELA
jgi:GNAT superfamily N-acetyltransferase